MSADEVMPTVRWYQFSLKSALVLLAVVSVAMAWSAYQVRWILQRHAVLRGHAGISVFRAGNTGDTRPAPWSLRLFGESGCEHLLIELPKSDPQSKRIEALFPETEIVWIAPAVRSLR